MINKNTEIDNSKLINFVKKNKKILKGNISKKEYDRRIANWQLFYLNNLDIFVEDILGIPIKEFQKQLLAQTMEYDRLNIVASRRLSKSFVISLVATSLALLLPNVQILIVSSQVGQANKIIAEKIDEMFTSEKSTKLNSPILQQLRKDGWIKFIKPSDSSGYVVEFGNNAKIFAVALNEGARGSGANIIIADESAIIPEKKYGAIILPTKELYSFKNFQMEAKEIMMTSARTRDNWIWKRLQSDVNEHYKNPKKKRVGFFAGDIFTSIANKLQTNEKYYDAKKNTDEFTFKSEYLNIWLGESADSVFKYDDFHNSQKLKTAYYPSYLEYDFCKKMEIDEDEWEKILAVDLAVVGGSQNDRTAIIMGRVHKKTNERVVDYIYPTNGMNSLEQASLMKRLFYDYGAKYITIDTKGLGNVIYDILTTKTEETEYYIGAEYIKDGFYPAWGSCEDKLLQISSDSVIKDKIQRIKDLEYESVIIPFTGTPELNSQAHYSVLNALRNKNLTLLTSNSEKTVEQNEIDTTFFLRNSNELADFYLPYLATDMLINEAIALDVKRNPNGQLKVSESDYKNTKDIYMAFAMFNLTCDKIYNKYLTEEYKAEEVNIEDFYDIYGI